MLMTVRNFTQIQSCLVRPLIDEAVDLLKDNTNESFTVLQLSWKLLGKVSAMHMQYLRNELQKLVASPDSFISFNERTSKYYYINNSEECNCCIVKS